MKPTFSSIESWQQAELLMQPVFIRLIDNIRKQLDQSEWIGTYRDIQHWPEGTSPGTQHRFMQLQDQLAQAEPADISEIQQELAQLPHPIPGYELRLQQGDRHITVDLWEICYQICFLNYSSIQQEHQISADIDTHLIDDAGNVDWNQLDEKAKRIVSDIFATLPSAGHHSA